MTGRANNNGRNRPMSEEQNQLLLSMLILEGELTVSIDIEGSG